MKDHQNHPQNQPQDHQNRLQGLQNPTYKEPPKGGLLIGVLLMVLEVVLVVLGVVLRQCSEQMFGTDVRNRQCSEQCSEPTKPPGATRRRGGGGGGWKNQCFHQAKATTGKRDG